eukprot:TRINITY_DN4619_c0_g1_i3.p1 TRINITY_DN4619_c0_g1~~TRINITY_DN4619_c0_g1_i3.p1  ORF type:complete len:173 (-),score=18.08 TRINITY_DN4619_c0_g1_i3:27-545(-)
MSRVIIAAILTAPIYALVLTPVERLKCTMQKSTTAEYKKGVFDCASKVVQKEGVSGLWRGYSVTVMTRVIGSPAYFVVYDLVKAKLGDQSKEVASWKLMASGAAAGTAFFTVNYPVDCVKSRVQSMNISVKRAIFGYSLKSLYRGFLPCIIRAPFANGVAFLGFEKTVNVLS